MKRQRLFVWGIIFLVLVLTTLPYLLAASKGGGKAVFGGFLLNPIDGHSYLAKMNQGRSGSWRFSLPYTAEVGEGGYLFLFYLFLGHLSRIFGSPPVLVFHLARIAGTIFMLRAIFRLFQRILRPGRELVYSFALAAFGAGMGWLVVPFGGFTADFWVAEAYPFLSAYANPHFPIGIGFLVILLTPPKEKESKYREVFSLLWAILLALILPFGVIIAGMILTVLVLAALVENRPFRWILFRLFWLTLGSAPILLYDYLVVINDPLLRVWNAQNLTPTPNPGDLLISFSPALLLAGVGSWWVLKGRSWPGFYLVLWAGVVLLLIYLPVNLQRRLLLGFYIPLASLTGKGLTWLSKSRPRSFLRLGIPAFLLSLPTIMLVLMAGIHGANTLDPALYLTGSEAAGLAWLRENSKVDDLVLASPETGLWIPSQTGRRVIYGHPFETVDTEAEKAAALAFFGSEELDDVDREEFLVARGVDFVFQGPRELALGDPQLPENLTVVFSKGNVTLYRVGAGVDGEP